MTTTRNDTLRSRRGYNDGKEELGHNNKEGGRREERNTTRRV